ncbi:hypothetical protein EMN47_20010 [Prolixibacteraceae bacterium JC049]|nr:hypothetical protein [Prolixibacteraceae bacterium JC049]
MKMLKLKVLGTALLIQMILLGACFGQEHKGEKHGEEDGTQFTQQQTYNVIKKGVRLILKYNKSQETFIGIMENVSKKKVKRARVEVHLSNGVELGPSKPKDLKVGEKIKVTLKAKGQVFKTWSTHAEVGSNEHGHGEGGEKGEHKNREGRGEHR